ncbi:MAG: TetR/AcrR family transcriptional regulator [Chlorobi bacterium]|nr:TetR/AcrR family transcriptional regulator [Chlorobiota bacterium]
MKTMTHNKFDKRKEEIKTAGIKSFTAYGYYKTTLEDIAGMLGMKKNSLYYYFESKEALFRELVEDEMAAHAAFLETTVQTNLPADKKLIKIISGLIEFIRERTMKYTVKLSAYLEIHKVIKSEFGDFQKKECKVLESILKEGIKSGLFVKHDAKRLAADIEYLVPAIFNSYYADSKAEFVHEVDFEEISSTIKRLIGYIINGIKVNKK